MNTKYDQRNNGLASRQLRYFIAVAENLHFGRAADTLDIAQSALSRQVRELETRLGVRLLNRGRRSTISLTESGFALLRDALIGVRALDRAANSARQAARGETGRVSVGFVASAAFSGVLSRTLRAYRKKHPQVSIDLEPMESPAQLGALAEGLIDVGFLRPPAILPTGIKAEVIHRDSMLLALAIDHPLAKRRIELKQLSKETFLVPQFEEGSAFAQQLAQLARAGGFEPKRVIHVKDFLTAVTMASVGYGVVPAPKSTLAIHLPNLTYKPIHGHSQLVDLVFAYLPRNTSAAVTSLIRELTHNKGTT